MANWNDPRVSAMGSATPGRAGSSERDAGLRSYMLSVYNYMAGGVLFTGIVAYLLAHSSLGEAIIFSPLRWVAILAPLAFVFALSAGVNRFSLSTLRGLFWAYAGVMGVSMSVIFFVYTGTSIAQTFFAAAAGFAGLSLLGYTTKKDLSAFGSFLIMGVFGLIIASLVGMFFHSSQLQFVISAFGVLIFAGLTAYDTQQIKSLYFMSSDREYTGKLAIMGALSLYLDFINMFNYLLSFMGDRR
ncbi:MAG: Bax inhibitor-1/YccA family protein [Zymomonas mobilis subsp. pomaceae]|uniref:Bax inhibitor-1/YccA family protein n=1 Tax=Zymomonas mobilis TaxID=542 RepID=UPI0039EB337A